MKSGSENEKMHASGKQQFQPDIEQRTRRGLSPATRLSDTGYYTGYPHSLANGDVFYIQTSHMISTLLSVRS